MASSDIRWLVLAVVGIPWYWPAESSRVLMGMPVWALVSLGASLVCSLFTAWLLLRFCPDSEGGE